MKYLGKVKVYKRLDIYRNGDIIEELNIYLMNEKVNEYWTKWKQNVNK